MCITSAIKPTIAAIQELLDIKDQLRVCSGCRFDDGHQAMSSTVKSCTTCGETLEWTLQSYVSSWLRGLLTKGLIGLDMEKGHTLTNFAHLGELLLTPHGLQVGLEYPDHRELGDDATCACESEEVDEQAIPKVAAVEGGNTDHESNPENMDNEDVAALTPGTEPLVTKFCRSANPKAMLDLVEEEYNQDLLSRRLQGNAEKEALAITLLRQFIRKDPNFRPPAWMPKELLSLTDEVMQTRMTFLSALSSKPTHKEKKGHTNTIHPGITNSKLKRKLQSAAGEENDRRPAKQPKVFHHYPRGDGQDLWSIHAGPGC